MSFKLNKVAVIMSHYNGYFHLKEQIDSIFKQVNVQIHLYIRDDGSTDLKSLELLHKYDNDEHITIFYEDNVGVGNSFISCLKRVPKAYDYYCFADQDDVWLDKKLYNAICMIDNAFPCLYTSNQIVTDENLNRIGLRYKEKRLTKYEQILCGNELSGCTMVWNNLLNDQLINDQYPSTKLLQIRIHDVWVAAVASVIGKIVYDENGYILYRQHMNNVVGAFKKKENFFIKINRNIKALISRDEKGLICSLANELYNSYYMIIKDEKTKKALYIYANYKRDKKCKKEMLNDKELFKYASKHRIIFKVKVLFNIF